MLYLSFNMNINEIPDKFKNFELNEKINEENNIIIHEKYYNFNETVNNYNDIERILNLYKISNVDKNIFFDFVYKHKNIILKNILNFIVFNENFYLLYSFINLLKSIESIYDNIMIYGDLQLLDYLFERRLINNNFSKYLIKNFNVINYVKTKHKYCIEPYNIVNYGMKINNINYLKHVYNNYIDVLLDKRNQCNIIIYCCKNKMNDWLEYFFEKNIYINYKKIICISLKYNNFNLFVNTINYKNIDIITEQEIVYFFTCASHSPNILSWLIKNKMDLYHPINEQILLNSTNTYNIINNPNYGDNNFLKKNLSNLTLCKFLQLHSMIENNIILAKWLIDNGIEKTTEFLNFAAYWWNTNNFIWLHKKGFNFNNKTIEKIVRIGSIEKLNYVAKCNYIFRFNYHLCNLAYINNHIKLIAFITSNNIDDRYIIQSIIDNNYDMFQELYKNYPKIEEYIFAGRNAKLYKQKLNEFISKYKLNDSCHNDRKRIKLI